MLLQVHQVPVEEGNEQLVRSTSACGENDHTVHGVTVFTRVKITQGGVEPPSPNRGVMLVFTRVTVYITMLHTTTVQ